MSTRFRRLITPALFVTAAQCMHAQPAVESSVLAGGGAVAHSATMRLAGTFGQPIIGIGVGPARRLTQGFWFTPESNARSSTDVAVAGSSLLRLECSPNPFHRIATVRAILPRAEVTSLALHDLLGREVLSFGAAVRPAGSVSFDFDSEILPQGRYTLVLTAGNDRISLPVHIVR